MSRVQRPLSDDDFIVLGPNGSLRRSIDLPVSYDVLGSSGNCKVTATGVVKWAASEIRGCVSGGSKILEMPYITSPMSIKFNPEDGLRHMAELEKRVDFHPDGESGCNSTEYPHIRYAFFQTRLSAMTAASAIENRKNRSM